MIDIPKDITAEVGEVYISRECKYPSIKLKVRGTKRTGRKKLVNWRILKVQSHFNILGGGGMGKPQMRLEEWAK